MSSCPTCGTRFKYVDLVGGLNPGNIKCGGCGGRIKSSNKIAIPFLAIGGILGLAFLIAPISLAWIVRVFILIAIVAVLDYIYYRFLSKGTIKSNLIIEE